MTEEKKSRGIGRRWSDWYAKVVAPVALGLGIVLMIIASAISYVSIMRADQVEQSELRACERVQRLRDQGLNVTSRVIYETLTTAAEDSGSGEYRGLAQAVYYFPPTDCEQAVKHPNSYVRPSPIPYGDYIRQQALRKRP